MKNTLLICLIKFITVFIKPFNALLITRELVFNRIIISCKAFILSKNKIF